MNPNPRNRGLGKDFLLASLLVTAGLVLSSLSLIELAKGNVQMAQATQPLQAWRSPYLAAGSGRKDRAADSAKIAPTGILPSWRPRESGASSIPRRSRRMSYRRSRNDGTRRLTPF